MEKIGKGIGRNMKQEVARGREKNLEQGTENDKGRERRFRKR